MCHRRSWVVVSQVDGSEIEGFDRLVIEGVPDDVVHFGGR
jgi:hypothetical protein